MATYTWPKKYIQHSRSILNIDIAELATIPSNAIIQIPRIHLTRRPIQVNEVVLGRILRQNVHAVFGILHLPDPPDAVHHAVVEPEDRVAWRREEVLVQSAQRTGRRNSAGQGRRY